MSSVSERATPRKPARFEPSKPDFVVRSEDPHQRGRWLTLGAGWRGEARDGTEVITVRLNTIPVNGWDGRLKLLVPLEGDDPGEQREE